MKTVFRRGACFFSVLLCLFFLLSFSFAAADDAAGWMQEHISALVLVDGEWKPLVMAYGCEALSSLFADGPITLEYLDQYLGSRGFGEIPHFDLTDDFACQVISDAPFTKSENKCLFYRLDGNELGSPEAAVSWDLLEKGSYLVEILCCYEEHGNALSGNALFWLQNPQDPAPDDRSAPISWMRDHISVSAFADGAWQSVPKELQYEHSRGGPYGDGILMSGLPNSFGSQAPFPQFVLSDEFVCRISADVPFSESTSRLFYYQDNGTEAISLDGISDWNELSAGRYLVAVNCYISLANSDWEYNGRRSNIYYGGAGLFWLLIEPSQTSSPTSSPTQSLLSDPASSAAPSTNLVPIIPAVLWAVDAFLLVLLIRRKIKKSA